MHPILRILVACVGFVVYNTNTRPESPADISYTVERSVAAAFPINPNRVTWCSCIGSGFGRKILALTPLRRSLDLVAWFPVALPLSWELVIQLEEESRRDRSA